MLKLFYFLLIFPTLSFTANAKGPIDVTADLLKSGNITELSKMFASTVELTILNDENIYSAAQAEMVLQKFFKNNPIKSVNILHRVNSNANFRFAVFIITTAGGIYRTSVSLKMTEGQFLINEIRIETEKKG